LGELEMLTAEAVVFSLAAEIETMNLGSGHAVVVILVSRGLLVEVEVAVLVEEQETCLH
jgi:hypothetical protein